MVRVVGYHIERKREEEGMGEVSQEEQSLDFEKTNWKCGPQWNEVDFLQTMSEDRSC